MAQSQHFCVVHVQHNGTYMLVTSKRKATLQPSTDD
jgi:hypothetical protein